jgi:hypothetical protein
MSIEALWAVQFTGANGVRIAKSGGVIVIESGRIFGGDTWMWYTGRYERDVKTGKLTCALQTGVHFTQGGQSIFGGALQGRKLVGEIVVADDQRTASADLAVEGAPQMRLTATLTWVAPLP